MEKIMDKKYIEEEIEESIECETGLEEYMRRCAITQIELIRFNEFKDRKCPVVLH